jgi:hypothetical protein
VLRQAVAAVAEDVARGWWGVGGTLRRLAPLLPSELHDEALALASAMLYGNAGPEPLAALVPHVPAALLARAVVTAGAIGDPYWQAHAVAGLAPHLPAGERLRAVAALAILSHEP